jgi:hypothetical protein
MPFPRGRNVPLSVPRRLIGDLMHFSRAVPLVSMERRFELRAVAEARQALAERPSWFALFAKAFGAVARRRPVLRRAYLPFPWPHLHEHACNVASITVARRLGYEEAVLFLRVRDPELRPLAELHRLIRAAKEKPVYEVASFRPALRMSRLPRPVRRLGWWLGLNVLPTWRARYFGTFGLTGVSNVGAFQLHLLSPLTCTLTYGVLAADGSLTVRLTYDHRVLDGVEPAGALADLEQTLRGPILDELDNLRTGAAA